MSKINYTTYINKLEKQLRKENVCDSVVVKLNQIRWIMNLSDCDQAQMVFDIWYKEMVLGEM